MEEKKILYLNFVYETLDLTLITFQAFDTFSYSRFLQELETDEDYPDLVIFLSHLRLISQIGLYYKKQENQAFLTILDLPVEKIKKILSVLTKVLNTGFCKQKLDFIFFGFSTESGILDAKVKIDEMAKIELYSFWFLNFKKRFNFLTKKLMIKPYPKTANLFISYFYMLKGLTLLKFYASLGKK